MPILVGDTSGIAQGISTAGGALAGALEKRAERRLLGQQKQQEQEQKQKGMTAISNWASTYDSQKSPMENIGTLSTLLQQENIDPSVMQPILQDVLKKSISQEGDQYGASQIFGNRQTQPTQASNNTQQQPQQQMPQQQMPQQAQDQMAQFSNQDLVKMAANPNKIVSQTSKAEIEKRKIDQKVSESDRKYHTQFSIKQEEKIAGLREAIPKKRSALRHARSAVESDQVGAFSINQLADSIGGAAGDILRTAKGSQLVTAGKENLLGNMARVSAKAQNQWFEQRLASMFPRVGQSKEANLAIQEMLEAELVMEDAYLKKFDEFAAEDEALYGYPKKDVERRARQAVEHLEDVSFNRSAYRLRQLEESEFGKGGMIKQMNKKVQKGTPMTLEMGALFLDKYKDPKTALDNAKKLGYSIPNGEDLQLYLISNEEFAQRLEGM
tara:strand:- start:33418 stop:34737 length:1320 start_codon:yes stop_codon:yes gene_type:complete